MQPDLRPDPRAFLDDAGRSWLEKAMREARADPARVPVLFPQLPRRLGKEHVAGLAIAEAGGVRVDLAAWRRCDLGALWLLSDSAAAADPALRVDLFHRGDGEERTMVLRAHAALPVDAATVALLGEVQRTNHGVHVRAGALDSNLVARAVDASAKPTGGARFALADFNRLIVKLAFLDLPLQRVFGAARHANPELSRMLQDLATEREAAGRKVWHDTNRLVAHAPTDGTIARLLGGLEHGDDATRLAAAEGLATLRRSELAGFLRERVAREPRAEIRALLESALEG